MYERLTTEDLLERLEGLVACSERTPAAVIPLRDQIETCRGQLSSEQMRRLALLDEELAERPRRAEPMLSAPPDPIPWWWYLELVGEEGDRVD